MDEGCTTFFTCCPIVLNMSNIRSALIPPVVDPAIPHGIVIRIVMMQAKSGQVLLSDIAKPVVEMELITWKNPVMNDCPQVKPVPWNFNESETNKAEMTMDKT